jgi:DNA-binding NtrC family response regulator
MVADALRDVGYEVVAAHDAVSALRQLENQGPFVLMFSDVTMPGGMNGVELAQHVRAQHPDLPVLLTTGYSDSMTVTTREFPLLRKPYELTELRKQIEACIDGQA